MLNRLLQRFLTRRVERLFFAQGFIYTWVYWPWPSLRGLVDRFEDWHISRTERYFSEAETDGAF